MRLLLSLILAIALLGGLTSYWHWTQQRPSGHYLSDLRSHVALDIGQPGPRGNLLGIQPELFAGDYQSLERLRLKLAAYLDHARELGLLNERSVVVLPEHIGTWLLAVGEKAELYQAGSRRQALQWVAASNPLAFLRGLLDARGDWQDALLHTKARDMARDYQQLFGGLARDYGITLVAGSIVLPEPRVELGRLEVGPGPLYHTSLVFDRAGNPLGQPHRQRFRANGQEPMAAAAPLVVDTPAGRLGVLLGQTVEDDAAQAELARQQAELLALPSSPPGSEEAAREHQEALAGQLSGKGIRAAMQVQLRGRLWAPASQAQARLFDSEQVRQARDEPGAQLINLWL